MISVHSLNSLSEFTANGVVPQPVLLRCPCQSLKALSKIGANPLRQCVQKKSGFTTSAHNARQNRINFCEVLVHPVQKRPCSATILVGGAHSADVVWWTLSKHLILHIVVSCCGNHTAACQECLTREARESWCVAMATSFHCQLEGRF